MGHDPTFLKWFDIVAYSVLMTLVYFEISYWRNLMKNIFLIAGLNERYYFEPFLKACLSKDLAIHICDPSRYPIESSLVIEQSSVGIMHGQIDTVQLLDGGTIHESSLSLTEIDVAWYVRENHGSSVSESDSLEQRFAHNETRQSLRALFSVLDCKWVNKQESIEYVNSNKLYQQLIAASCGLTIPQTIISNDPEHVARFSGLQDGLLLKSLGCIKLDKNGDSALYSERFSHKEIMNGSDAIRVCPIFGQEYIEKLCEHRVMVIGNRVLSCRIDSQASEATKVDWRHYDFDNVEHTQSYLPADVQQKLLGFMEKIELRYGAIDLIETPDEDFVFLEINPSGQWGWIADLAGLPIPEAVADMLDYL